LIPDGPGETIFSIFFVLIGVIVLATVAFGVVFENIFEAYDGILDAAKANTSDKFMKKLKKTNEMDDEESEHTSMQWDMLKEFVSVLPLYILLVLGALFIGNVEGWDGLKSIYFLIVTATTGEFL